MSKSNSGKWLEAEVQMIADRYREQCTLDIAKVDPPTRVLWTPQAKLRPGQPQQRIIMLDSPFLDYVGVWTERGGRAVALEAKSTEKEQLPLNQESGLKEDQVNGLRRWEDAGAAVGVLWGMGEEIRFVPLVAIEERLRAGVKHIKWDQARPIPRGFGYVTWNFLETLRLYYPEKAR